MTDKQKEAIETLFHLEHINGYVNLYEKHDVIIKSDILLKWKNATKEVLNLIQTQQTEIEHQKEKRENQKKELAILNEKQKEFNKLRNTVNSYKGQFKRQQAEIEKKDKESHFIQIELDIANAKIIKLNKIIDLMAYDIATNDSDLCQYIDETRRCKKYAGENKLTCDECIKQYFERKVENGN